MPAQRHKKARGNATGAQIPPQSTHPQAQARPRSSTGQGGVGAIEIVFVALEIGFIITEIHFGGKEIDFGVTEIDFGVTEIDFGVIEIDLGLQKLILGF